MFASSKGKKHVKNDYTWGEEDDIEGCHLMGNLRIFFGRIGRDSQIFVSARGGDMNSNGDGSVDALLLLRPGHLLQRSEV